MSQVAMLARIYMTIKFVQLYGEYREVFDYALGVAASMISDMIFLVESICPLLLMASW